MPTSVHEANKMYRIIIKHIELETAQNLVEELNDKTQFLDDHGIYTLQEFNKYIVKPDYEVITKLLKSKDDVA